MAAETKTFNASAAIAAGQPVKLTGAYTSIGMPCVAPCDEGDAIGKASRPANAGENVTVEINEKPTNKKETT